MILPDDTRPIKDVRSELAILEHRYRQVLEALSLDPLTTTHAELIEIIKLLANQ